MDRPSKLDEHARREWHFQNLQQQWENGGCDPDAFRRSIAAHLAQRDRVLAETQQALSEALVGAR